MSPFTQGLNSFAQINAYQPTHKILPWYWLNNRAKFIYQDIIAEWNNLLHKGQMPEKEYTQYLSTYPACFLMNNHYSFIAISEFRLGSEFVVDFVIPTDDQSRGFIYEMIEVELPYSDLYKQNGDKSARLNHAIDQIESWQTWLDNNQSVIDDFFPGVFSHWKNHFTFSIIIGTRENTRQWLTKRNNLYDRYKISVRSFDSLTDNGNRMLFTDAMCDSFSAQAGNLSKYIRNALANPFYRAFSYKEWRNIVNKSVPVSHFVECNADIILQARKYGPELHVFETYCNNVPVQLIDEHCANI